MARAKRSGQRPNIVHRGQRAVLNGKPVIADGKGNWVAQTKGTYGNAQYSGKKSGTYKKGENRKRTPTKAKPVKVPDHIGMTKGKVYGEKPLTENQKLARSDRKMDRSPKPTPPKPAPPKPASPKPTPTKPARKPQSKDMDANYKAWAKANPGLAKKVKKGQSGYKAIKSSSPKAASAADAQNLKSGPTPPKRTSLKTTTAKPAEKKPAKQKPLTVPTNKIPKNLSGAAGKKYLADLDAGKLTRKKK